MKSPDFREADAAFVRAAFWIVLGRAPNGVELRDQLKALATSERRSFADRLLTSPEFRLVIYSRWHDGAEIGRDPVAHEAALREIGSHRAFVDCAFGVLLGRDPDPEGRAYYAAALAQGGARIQVLRALVLSEEFETRYREIAPDAGVVPRDVQLCELANPAKWDNPDWMTLLRSLEVVADHRLSMHRKSYELTQLLFGLTRLGRCRDTASVISVGAGHEPVLYWLANRVQSIVATDLYQGKWRSDGAREGDEGVLDKPEDYAPFAYRRDRLTFNRMDGRHLEFDSGTFDVAYSLSSIEHFGGVAGARDAIDEMARVVKPGGLVVVATEYILSGPPHEEAFQPTDVRALFDRPRLRLVEPIDERVYQRYEYVAVDLRRNPHQTPHMVVRDGDTVFTSVMVFLERI
jgi:SAM-dependent methyltransferase